MMLLPQGTWTDSQRRNKKACRGPTSCPAEPTPTGCSHRTTGFCCWCAVADTDNEEGRILTRVCPILDASSHPTDLDITQALRNILHGYHGWDPAHVRSMTQGHAAITSRHEARAQTKEDHGHARVTQLIGNARPLLSHDLPFCCVRCEDDAMHRVIRAHLAAYGVRREHERQGVDSIWRWEDGEHQWKRHQRLLHGGPQKRCF